MTPQQQPYANTREDSPVRFLGIPTLMKSTGETTNGAFGLLEQYSMPPGFASPYHKHHLEDEAFYVLEGQIAFVCDGHWTNAGPGTYVFGPREIPHGFKVVGSSPARMLLLCSPGGFERFVLELSEPFDPAKPPSPPDMGRLMAVAAQYKIDILGPLPEQTGSAAAKSDGEMIDSVREAHITALNAGDAAAFADLFVADALQMPPNAPANRGKSAIRAWGDAFMSAFRLKFALSVAEVQLAADRAIESGAYSITLTSHAGGPGMHDQGKYITIYERGSNGEWAISRDIWNSDQPLPGR
jgi:uncharacterized protein (TIGR02246 family)